MEGNLNMLFSNGRVILPEKLRKELNLTGGDKMAVYVHRQSVRLVPVRMPGTERIQRDAGKNEPLAEAEISEVIREYRMRKRYENCN